MPYKSQAQLAKSHAAAAQRVTVGAHYVYYEDETRLYEVVGFATIQATDEIGVIYRAAYGQRITFVRPLKEWTAHTMHDGKRVPCFQKIECDASRQTG